MLSVVASDGMAALQAQWSWMEAFIAAGAWQAERMMAASQKTLYDKAASFGYTGYINQGLVTPNIKNLDKHYKDQQTALKLLEDLHEKVRSFNWPS